MIRRIRFADTLLILLGIAIVYGQRFVLPVGEFFIPMIIFLVFPIVFLWYYLGYVFIEPTRFLLYIIALVGLLISAGIALYYSDGASLFSFLYLVILYIPILFVARDSNKYELLLNTFQISMLIAACLGIIQFFSQFIGISHQDVLGSIFKQIISPLYNFSIPLEYGSNIYKANAYFFLEPSHFSQWLSIAILIEIYFFRKFKRLFLFIPAILVTFSGTGLLSLMVGLLPVLLRLRPKYIFRLGLIFILLLGMFSASDLAGATYRRIGEFNNPNTSAYIRFIAPYKLYSEYLHTYPNKIWLGTGPGTVDVDLEGRGEGQIPRAHAPLFIKLFFEYGIAGMGFLVFIMAAFFRRTNFILLSFVLFFIFSVLGTGILNAPTLYLCYALGMLFIRLNNESYFMSRSSYSLNSDLGH